MTWLNLQYLAMQLNEDETKCEYIFHSHSHAYIPFLKQKCITFIFQCTETTNFKSTSASSCARNIFYTKMCCNQCKKIIHSISEVSTQARWATIKQKKYAVKIEKINANSANSIYKRITCTPRACSESCRSKVNWPQFYFTSKCWFIDCFEQISRQKIDRKPNDRPYEQWWK